MKEEERRGRGKGGEDYDDREERGRKQVREERKGERRNEREEELERRGREGGR